MKNYLVLFLCFVAASVAGQELIEVKVEDRPSSLGVQTAFEVVVPQATPDEAIDLLKSTITPKKLFKKTAKFEKVKDEWQVSNIIIDDITSLPLNVITQVSTYPGHIYVRIFLQSEGGFLGSSGSSRQTTESAIKFIHNYAVDLYRLAVEKELKSAEKELKSLEKEQDRLISKNKKYNSKIDEAQQEKIELKGSANYQQRVLKDSDNLRMNEESADQLKKELKATEKELKKAKRAEAKFERKSKRNLKDQRDKTREIEIQKIKVEEIKLKLQNIR